MIASVKTALGVDTTKFDYFIIIFSEAVGDTWTSGNGSIFEPTIMATGTICHEMTHQFGENLPPNPPNKEQLANDNNLFMSFAKKLLALGRAGRPGPNCWPDLFRWHQGPRCVPHHDVRGSHPDEHWNALIRPDYCRLKSKSSASNPKILS